MLVLAVAVSIASLYAGWAPAWTENITKSFTEDSREDIKCTNAGLSIRNAKYDRSDLDLTFDLVNTETVRFPGDINLLALNNSLVVKQKTVKGLDVGETLKVTMVIQKEPDQIMASPTDCARITSKENFINVTD